MFHPVINDNLNYYLVEVFNYDACEILPNIAKELGFIAYSRSLEKTATLEIVIMRDVLKLEGYS